jgi:plasmid stabilization system protein ParE
VTLAVVWTPEANEDLLDARAWYDNIRPQLGERFALAVDATVEALADHPLQSRLFTEAVGARECGAFRTEYSSKLRSIGSR